MSDMLAAKAELSPLQAGYATTAFVMMESGQRNALKNAFASMDGSKLVGVAKALKPLDSSNIAKTMTLMGGSSPEQLKDMTRWMQNPEQLSKFADTLKSTSSAEFGTMTSNDFYSKLKGNIEPAKPVQQAQAKPEAPQVIATTPPIQQEARRAANIQSEVRPAAPSQQELRPVAPVQQEARAVAPVQPELRPAATAQPEVRPAATAQPESRPAAPVQRENKPIAQVQPEARPTAQVQPEARPLAPVQQAARLAAPAQAGRPDQVAQPQTVARSDMPPRAAQADHVPPPQVQPNDHQQQRPQDRVPPPTVARQEAKTAQPAPAEDPMMKMLDSLTPEQRAKITPEVMAKGMETMDKLHLKPEDLEKLGKKFSNLMPPGSDKNGKGFEMGLHIMDKMSAEQLRPVLNFANRVSPGDARLLKSIGGGMPSDPEGLIDRASHMSPRQIQAKLGEAEQFLSFYHQVPSEFRPFVKSIARSMAPRM
jgi:hypothetical protein